MNRPALISGILVQDEVYRDDLLLQRSYEVLRGSRDVEMNASLNLRAFWIYDKVKQILLSSGDLGSILTLLRQALNGWLYSLEGQISVDTFL